MPYCIIIKKTGELEEKNTKKTLEYLIWHKLIVFRHKISLQ